jgi:hypothetical protein
MMLWASVDVHGCSRRRNPTDFGETLLAQPQYTSSISPIGIQALPFLCEQGQPTDRIFTVEDFSPLRLRADHHETVSIVSYAGALVFLRNWEENSYNQTKREAP